VIVIVLEEEAVGIGLIMPLYGQQKPGEAREEAHEEASSTG
jgi:hypothetical protein